MTDNKIFEKESSEKNDSFSHDKKLISALLLLLAAVVWGGAFVAQSLAGAEIGTFTFNGIRFIIGGLCILPMMPKHKLSNLSGSKENIIGAAVCGVALFLASTCQQAGIALGADAGEAGFITACYIIMVPILGIFLGKKCPAKIWVAAGITMVGLYLLCFSDVGQEGAVAGSGIAVLIGLLRNIFSWTDLLLLGCAFLFSIQIICIDRYSPRMHPITLTCTEFMVSGVLSLICGFFFDFLPDKQGFVTSLMTPTVWISILYTGILSSAVGYTLQTVSQRKLHPAVASLIMSMESVFAAIFGWLILGQVMSVRELIGCGLIFGAIIITQVEI
ncbi:DMT family transporter [Butyrivibrio sp. MB2005]|uniref:DMT family transporter n=1 Tax=Butyrivibrio sp. MB2005 TaxID=1280678 RepID=UPI00041457B1|nr:DMT family transporter [Butyrivibrio sp. MB2005]